LSNELHEIIRALETDGSRSDSLILMGRIVGWDSIVAEIHGHTRLNGGRILRHATIFKAGLKIVAIKGMLNLLNGGVVVMKANANVAALRTSISRRYLFHSDARGEWLGAKGGDRPRFGKAWAEFLTKGAAAKFPRFPTDDRLDRRG
jgi:hypothetical protein